MALLEHSQAEALRERPVIRTSRLVLRAPRTTDIKSIAALANDLRVAAMTARIPHPYSEANAEEFIAQLPDRDAMVFAIALNGGPLIGLCGIDHERGKNSEIGYWLGAPHWGQGFATEAVQAMLGHAFVNLGLDVLDAGARVVNPASRRVLEKCGFEWTGVILSRVRALGASVPVDRFKLPRERWIALQGADEDRQVA